MSGAAPGVRAASAGALLAVALLAHAAAGPGTAVVERLHAALLENIAAGAARDLQARARALEPVVSQVFDFETIARVAMGRTWDTLDAPRRARLQALLRRESVYTYADRFHGGGDRVRFVVDEEQPSRGGRLLVRTRLVRDGEEPVSLDYVIQDAAGRWRIVNVLAQGVSDLSLKRAQYAAVIRDEGVDALLRRLEEQVAQLESGGGS